VNGPGVLVTSWDQLLLAAVTASPTASIYSAQMFIDDRQRFFRARPAPVAARAENRRNERLEE